MEEKSAKIGNANINNFLRYDTEEFLRLDNTSHDLFRAAPVF